MADEQKKLAASKRTLRRSGVSVSSILQRFGIAAGGGRNIIGIEISGAVLRIIEIDRGANPPKVINFSAIDPLMDNVQEATDQILGLMHEKNIIASTVHSLVCESGVEHRQVSLPVLGKNEMQALVRREVKKIVPDSGGRDVASDFWLDRSVRHSGRKADVLIGVVPREIPTQIINLMEHCELETQLISTVPLSLIAALGALGKKTSDSISAMVHLERERSFLVISNRGNWVFSREFQSVLSKETAPGGEDVSLQARRQFASARYLADQERLLIEVNRSLLYFKQRFRGEGVSLIVLSGEAFNLDEIVVAIGKNIGIESTTFAPIESFQTKHLGDRAGKLERIFPSLALPLGAALQNVKDAKLNFVPPTYVSRRKSRLRRTLTIVAAAAFLIALSLGYLVIRKTRVQLEQALKESHKEEQLADLNRRLKESEETNRQRDLADSRRKFLDSFNAPVSPERMLLLALSNYVPDQAFLLDVKMDAIGGKTQVQIVGQIKDLSMAATDSTLNIFYQRLQNSGLFEQIKEPRLNGVADSGKYVLSFMIDSILSSKVPG